MITVLLLMQGFHVLFLALHDWLPLGRLNDVEAAHAANPGSKLLITTFASTVPYLCGLLASLEYLDKPYPKWLWVWLWLNYLLLFLGELRAWWAPYFFGASPELAARYGAMFGRTSAILPARHGIRPNTLHVILHVATLATLFALAVLTIRDA